MVDLLYGDHEGGQRTIARFGITDWPEVEGERAEVLRYWNVDRDDRGEPAGAGARPPRLRTIGK